jgi:glyceraldehyde-3-phosphate dehydrogenase (ferredoxin)
MPLMGKYYVFYGQDLLAPEEVGRRNVQRMIGELLSDNAGMCRFHRQWGEPMAAILLARHRGLPEDYAARVTRLAGELFASAEAESCFWETPRLIALFRSYWRWQRERGVDLTPVAPFLPQKRMRANGLPKQSTGCSPKEATPPGKRLLSAIGRRSAPPNARRWLKP